MNETELDRFLRSTETPLPERTLAALEVVHSTSEYPSIRARAACWMAYRALEDYHTGEMIPELEEQLAVNASDTGFLKIRWRMSLLMALAYCQLNSKENPCSSLIALFDEPALVTDNPTAIVNVCRAAVLFCALNRDNRPVADPIHRQCADIFKTGISLLTLHTCANVIGEEMLCAARAVYISVRLQNGALISEISPIEPSQPFNRALTLAYLSAA